MVEILDKTKEWSDRFGGILRASAETQFPWLYKGAVGGMTHVISVDNGAVYMEAWRDGSDNYYATTGAAIKPLPGLAKGARLDEALDRFFVLMAKVEKDAGGRPIRKHRDAQGSTKHHQAPASRGDISNPPKGMVERWPGGGHGSVYEPKQPPPKWTGGKRPAQKAIPKKLKRLAGVRKDFPPTASSREEVTEVGGAWRDKPRGPRRADSGMRLPAKPQVKKNIVEKVDPEIGPSMSVGHRKPSDLSPESSMRKLAKRIIKDINRLNKTSAADYIRYAPHFREGKPHTPPSSSCPNCPKKPPVQKPPVQKNVVALTGNQPGSGRVKPARTRMVRQDGMGRKTSSRRSKPDFGRMQEKLEGGRTQPGGGTAPVRMPKGGPGQPSNYGSTGQPQYRYGRKQRKPGQSFWVSQRGEGKTRPVSKACVCDEVNKTMKAVAKWQPKGADMPMPKPLKKPATTPARKPMTEEERFRRGGASAKPTKPMHPGQRMGGNLETTGGW